MTKEELQLAFEKISNLLDEFNSKWRNKDFKYQKERDANENRVREIIGSVVQIITSNKKLEDFIFEGENSAFVEHMELRGFRNVNGFQSYVTQLLRRIEKELEMLD